jgi:ribosomal-protein-serine acetyltransferase
LGTSVPYRATRILKGGEGGAMHERIQLRPPDTDDVLPFYLLVERERDRLRPWLPWVAGIRSPEDAQTYLSNALHHLSLGIRYPLLINVDGTLAGMTTLSVDRGDRTGCLGYWIAREFGGAGVVTLCARTLFEIGFRQLTLNRIEIRAATGNHRSRAVAWRLGLSHEGTLRRAAVVDGTVQDVDLYAAVSDEWPHRGPGHSGVGVPGAVPGSGPQPLDPVLELGDLRVKLRDELVQLPGHRLPIVEMGRVVPEHR